MPTLCIRTQVVTSSPNSLDRLPCRTVEHSSLWHARAGSALLGGVGRGSGARGVRHGEPCGVRHGEPYGFWRKTWLFLTSEGHKSLHLLVLTDFPLVSSTNSLQTKSLRQLTRNRCIRRIQWKILLLDWTAPSAPSSLITNDGKRQENPPNVTISNQLT